MLRLKNMLRKNQNREALVVVAHCDDAVLWMGGTIRHLRDWEWHILSMCDGNDDRRIQSFYKSCEMLRVDKSRVQALNFLDYPKGDFSQNKKEEMKSQLTKLMDESYDFVFSHGLQEWNEYGHHANHQEVGTIALEIAEEKCWQLVQFCYRPIYPSGTATVANTKANYYFQLSYEELKFKLALIDCFPHEMTNLKGLSYPCPNPEAFEGDSLPAPPFVKA